MPFRWIPSAIVLLVMAGLGDRGRAGEAPAYPEHQDLSYWLSNDGQRRDVKTPADWQRRRDHVLRHVQSVMGPLPQPARPVPLDPRVVADASTDAIRRQKIALHADSSQAVVHAWLLVPKSLAGRTSPAVICLHQTTDAGKDETAGLAGRVNMHYALHLAERGYVTLAPDYPSLGEHEYDFSTDRYESGSMKAVYDNIRAVDYLASLPEVDAERIGAIGHSLGGHNAIFTALFEPRIKVVVTSCGFTRFHRYYGGDLTGWSGPRYMPLIAERYEKDPDKVPFDFPDLIAALAPRPFLAVAPLEDHNFDVNGVRETMASAAPVYRLFGAEDRLRAVYPAGGHDFLPEARRPAYEFLDAHLRSDSPAP